MQRVPSSHPPAVKSVFSHEDLDRIWDLTYKPNSILIGSAVLHNDTQRDHTICVSGCNYALRAGNVT